MSDDHDLYRLAQYPEWFDDARCNPANTEGIDRDIFFIDGKNSWLLIPPKMICIGETPGKACPVRLSCLEYGMMEQWGIFGGMSPRERGQLKRQFKRGKSIHKEIEKLDKVTRERAKILKQREGRTNREYVSEAKQRERNIEKLTCYLESRKNHKSTITHIRAFMKKDEQELLDTIRIARSRGLIEPVFPAYSGKEQTWRLKDG